MNGKATAQTNVPTKIYGIRLPILVCVLSDNRPKIGSKINAAKLSIAIIIPTRYCTSLSLVTPNEFLNNSVKRGGHHES